MVLYKMRGNSLTEDVLGFYGGGGGSSASGVAVLVSRWHTGIRYGLRGSEFAPEVHYFSCAGTHMSVSYAFESHGMCRFYPSGCQSTGSLSVAIGRSEGRGIDWTVAMYLCNKNRPCQYLLLICFQCNNLYAAWCVCTL
jgi:hypothetical protein